MKSWVCEVPGHPVIVYPHLLVDSGTTIDVPGAPIVCYEIWARKCKIIVSSFKHENGRLEMRSMTKIPIADPQIFEKVEAIIRGQKN